jgi:hypothetical protein
MKTLLNIGEKRMREEGKETAFCHGSSTIASEKFENFKKRKVTSEEEDSYPSIGESLHLDENDHTSNQAGT